METLLFALNQYLELIAYVFLGYLLRRFGIFKESDGETALRFARYITIPALIVSTLGDITLQSWMLFFPAAAVLHAVISTAITLVVSRNRPRREKAQLLGSSVGTGVSMLGYPFIEATFGPTGLLAAILFDLPNIVIKHVLAYFMYASAGPVFPENYKHDDEGTYQGEWRGTKKEGLGVYKYPSGAKYEGEWRDNVKQGRGVYYFPKGGIYEGEWSEGNPDGIGVRTFSSGQVKAGRWAAGKLVEPLELWQCSNAVQGAVEASDAAKKIEIGGGNWKEALTNLAKDVPFWATLFVIVMNGLMLDIPMALESAALSLSAANKCLILLAVGIMLKNQAQPRQYPDLFKVVTARYIPALLIGIILPFANHSFHFNEFPAVAFTLVAMLSMLSPVPHESLQLTKRFRLGSTFAEALYHGSAVSSMAMFTIIGLLSYVAATAGVYELVNVACGAIGVVLILQTFIITRWTQNKVKMTLEVPQPGASSSAAASTPNKPATGTTALPAPTPALVPARIGFVGTTAPPTRNRGAVLRGSTPAVAPKRTRVIGGAFKAVKTTTAVLKAF